MAQRVKGLAIIAVCDLTDNPDLARRENASAGTMVIYRDGREVARSEGGSSAAFSGEMKRLGLSM